MITTRKATTADISLINELATEAFPYTYREILTPEQIDYMMDWMYSPESLRRQMEEEGHHYYLIYKDGQAAGYVSIQQEGDDLFHLQKIYVLPAFWKDGLGRRLFEVAVNAIRDLHPTPCRMELNVNRHNPARGFYEHMGMQKVHEGDFPIGNGFYMNDYIMGMDILSASAERLNTLRISSERQMAAGSFNKLSCSHLSFSELIRSAYSSQTR